LFLGQTESTTFGQSPGLECVKMYHVFSCRKKETWLLEIGTGSSWRSFFV